MGQEFDAIVLAGGSATRMGRNKLQESLGSRTILEELIASLADASTVVIVGTPETVDFDKLRWATERTDENLILVSEVPAGSGPAMGIAAGARALAKSDTNKPVTVFGGDMPFAAQAAEPLLAALDERNVAILSDGSDQPQYLASAWSHSALLAATAGTQPGDSVKSVFAGLDFAIVADHTNAAFDIDDENDLEFAKSRLDAS